VRDYASRNTGVVIDQSAVLICCGGRLSIELRKVLTRKLQLKCPVCHGWQSTYQLHVRSGVYIEIYDALGVDDDVDVDTIISKCEFHEIKYKKVWNGVYVYMDEYMYRVMYRYKKRVSE